MAKVRVRWCLVALATLTLVACRTRDPDASGLLDDGAVSGEPETDAPALADLPREVVSPEGNWRLSCKPAEPLEGQPPPKPGSASAFTLTVLGAARPDDETQPLRVSLAVTRGGKDETLATNEMGRGQVDPKGPVFVGFESGVLTADFNAALAAGVGTHLGVLTLAKLQDADAVSVACRMEQVKGKSPF